MPIATPEVYNEMLDRAKQGGFAFPAINCTSSETINAALRGFAEAESDGIIQFSTGGAAFGSGLALKDKVKGAQALAAFAHEAAKHYGVKALGVTLSQEQADWAKLAIDREGLGDLAEVRFMDYRDVPESDFDAISSIGLTEHIGVANYPAYFAAMRDKLRPHGRLLNHCITRDHNRSTRTGAFIDRYVFPDGELTGAGTVIARMQDAGLEMQHAENFRVHYARTLAGWVDNLVEHWDEAVAEVGEGTARLWGLYMAGCRIGFERNIVQLHHVLATKLDDYGQSDLPLRPWWDA